MSCDSPFELDLSYITLYTIPMDISVSGSVTVPALSIPSSVTCDTWVTKGGWTCTWVAATYSKKKTCSTVFTKWCWTKKQIEKCGYASCYWAKVNTDCSGWLDWPEVNVFPAINIPMNANIPFVISSGYDLAVDDVGLTESLITQYAIYQNYMIDGTSQTFKLSIDFGSPALTFDFYLPKGEVLTIYDSNGSFSATVSLYDFGSFPPYEAPSGFTYTLSMSLNLLFCLGSPVWLKLQVVTSTHISGWGIKPVDLPITYAIPLVPDE